MCMNIAIIPARSGSRRIKDKNIKEINSKPLIYWTIKAAEESKAINKIFVSTDSVEYKTFIEALLTLEGFKKAFVIMRDPAHATAYSQLEDFIIPFLYKTKATYVFILQPTSPIRLPGTIDKAFKYLKEQKADSLVSVSKFNRFLWKDNQPNYNLLKRPRSQDYQPGLCVENGSIYITKRKTLLDTKTRAGGKVVTFELKPEESFEIDEELDFVICSAILQYIINKEEK